MSKLKQFAEEEFNILIKNGGSVIVQFMPEILALIEKIGNSGQSGGSMPYVSSAVADTVQKLCMFEPITPIYGTDDEWIDVSDMADEPMWQNRRCSALFKDIEGQVSYVDALVKCTETSHWNGSFWLNKQDYLSGDVDLKISCKQYIRGFPFVPKTFYIDVIEEEVEKDDWEMFLKDMNQLEKAFEYYKRPPITRRVIIEKNNNFLL